MCNKRDTSGGKSTKNNGKNGVAHTELATLVIKGKGIFGALKRNLDGIDDARRSQSPDFKYKIVDVILAIVLAMLGGRTRVTEIHEFIAANNKFLHGLGLFINNEAKGRVPCMSHLYRLVESIDCLQFGAALLAFTQRLAVVKDGARFYVIAVDGKRMRGTSCGERNIPLNVLTAVIADLKLPMASVTCDEKENEITAWDSLLSLLNGKVVNALFTADAMGCQVKIVDTICKTLKCFYCLAVKKNQSGLYEDILTLIKHSKPAERFEETPEKNGEGWKSGWWKCSRHMTNQGARSFTTQKGGRVLNTS